MKNQRDLLSYKEEKQMFEIQYMQEVLATCDYNISRAAEKMEISHKQLLNQITEYEIDTKNKGGIFLLGNIFACRECFLFFYAFVTKILIFRGNKKQIFGSTSYKKIS